MVVLGGSSEGTQLGDLEVTANLAARRAERAAGVAEERLTPTLSWSGPSLSKRWNEMKDEVAPWWREVSMHASGPGSTRLPTR